MPVRSPFPQLRYLKLGRPEQPAVFPPFQLELEELSGSSSAALNSYLQLAVVCQDFSGSQCHQRMHPQVQMPRLGSITGRTNDRFVYAPSAIAHPSLPTDCRVSRADSTRSVATCRRTTISPRESVAASRRVRAIRRTTSQTSLSIPAERDKVPSVALWCPSFVFESTTVSPKSRCFLAAQFHRRRSAEISERADSIESPKLRRDPAIDSSSGRIGHWSGTCRKSVTLVNSHLGNRLSRPLNRIGSLPRELEHVAARA